MHLTLRQLGIFNVVAEKLSYTQAAETLHLTQPAVSIQVRRLQESVGLALFEQLGKRIYLTDAGRELLRYSRNIFQQLGEAGEMLAQIKDITRGTLSVSVATTASSFAARLIAAFLEQIPGATVRLDVTNRGTLLQQLEDNEKDLVIMGQPPPAMKLIGEAFMDNPLVMIASPRHPLAGHGTLALNDLRGAPFVMREAASGTRAAMERLFHAHGIEPTIQLEITDNEAIKEAVAAGLGLGVVSKHTLGLDVEAGRLVILAAEGFPIRRHWYLVSREDKHLSPIAAAFKAFVFERAPALEGGVAHEVGR